jgi:hypothetical protein
MVDKSECIDFCSQFDGFSTALLPHFVLSVVPISCPFALVSELGERPPPSSYYVSWGASPPSSIVPLLS